MKHNEAIPRNHLSELIQRLWLHRLRFLLLSRNSFSAWRGGRQHLQGKGM
jgi:cell division protein FtsB